jgi:hypothetical protein
MKSSYITSAQKTTKGKPIALMLIVSLIMAIFVGLTGGAAAASKDDKSVEAFDAVQWAMCYFGNDSLPGMMYQYTQTSDLQFATRSKSSVTGGVDNVDGGLNAILNVFGPGFKKINESVTGYSLEPFDPETEPNSTPAKNKFNKGAQVNPFDRFGVAGLKFTAYTGEWKHVVIDACSTEASEPQDPKAGVFYEERLEPRSTWEDISNSQDVRTIQFGKGFFTQLKVSFADVFANSIFFFTKAIVVVTIGLINFAFTDIVEVMGLNELLAGGSNGGIFGSLFNGLFTPLIVIIFALTGVNIFYLGIVKKRYRDSMTNVLRSIALFIIALIISTSPMLFITLPNTIAVVGQSIILTTMNSGLSGGNGMCSTDIGQLNTKLVTNENAKAEDILTQASTSMRSAVGCQLWQTFLLRPWAEGQFGTSWENTWAKDKTPSWAGNPSKEFQNSNESMVGDAAVPMGNGTFINNWALFQISAQTNAHTPIGHDGEKSKYTGGVANDWWRIVDALANYQEEEAEVIADGSGPYGESSKVTFTKAKPGPTLENWDSWVGNSTDARTWTAISSVIVAFVGLAAPLIFSFLSAVYSIGVAILMAFAPIMLLMGCWAGKGWEIFKGWGELVVNTTLKRIATGALLAISIGLEIVAIKMMDTIGWWQGMLMLVLVSIIIIKSRHKIIDSLASVRFASTNFSGTANNLYRKTTGVVTKTASAATNTAISGANSKRYGGSISGGLKAGLKNELKNLSYQNKTLRHAHASAEGVRAKDGTIDAGQETCVACGKQIDYEDDQFGLGVVNGARSADGNVYCLQCYTDGVDPEAMEVVFQRPDVKERKAPESILEKQQEELRKNRFTDKTAFGNNFAKNLIERIKTKTNSKGEVIDEDKNNNQLRELLKSVNYDIKNSNLDNGMPAIPLEIQDSVNHELIELAWKTKNYDWIRQAYTAAWAHWFVEETGSSLTNTLDELVASISDKKDS